ARALAALKAESDSAEAVAHRTLLKEIYGASSPYRLPGDGSEETVSKLTRDQALAFHRDHYRPGKAGIVVAGDVEPERLVRLFDRLLSGWTRAGIDRLPVPAP